MNQAHYHLLLNHLPIIIPFVGVAVMLVGIIFKSEIVKRTAYMIFITGAIFTFPASETGEGAEEIVENIEGISEEFIHTHEEASETFALLSYILGAVSLIGLWINLKKKSYSNIIVYVTILFSAVVMFFARQTGRTGGEIRHPEIRKDYQLNPAKAENEEEDEHDE